MKAAVCLQQRQQLAPIKCGTVDPFDTSSAAKRQLTVGRTAHHIAKAW